MRGAITLLPQYAFMAWCLLKHRDNFTFTFTCRKKQNGKITYIGGVERDQKVTGRPRRMGIAFRGRYRHEAE
jgi:hypothetical protein